MRPKRIPKQKTEQREKVDVFGLPNRIYRGRIIEALRNETLKQSQLFSLGKKVRKEFTERDLAWLKTVLVGLERDGLITLKNGTIQLA